MKKINLSLIIFLCLSQFIALAQNDIFTSEEQLYIQKNITNVLDSFTKYNNSSILWNSRYLNVPENTINRKKSPEQWEKRQQESIKLYFTIINTLGNYLDFTSTIRKRENKIVPPCYVEQCKRKKEIFIYHTPSMDEITDEDCKKEFIRMIKEKEVDIKLIEFRKPIFKTYDFAIQNLLLIFEWSDYTSLREFDTYVKPFESLLSTEDIKKNFQNRTRVYIQNKLKIEKR